MHAAPLTLTIYSYLHHIWNLHPNSAFYREMLTIFLSLLLTTGSRIVKLLLMILSRWKQTLSTNIAYLFDFKLPIPWTYYKRGRHQGHSNNKRRIFMRVSFTSVFNVDDKLNKSNSNSMFDIDATFVVCDNSANTQICNNRSMFTKFNFFLKESWPQLVVSSTG